MLYILAVALLAAQSQPAPKPEAKLDPNAPLTMNGCVTRDYTDSKNVNAYTFVDNVDGARYRLKGKSVSKYSGMSVEVIGSLEGTSSVLPADTLSRCALLRCGAGAGVEGSCDLL